MKLYIAGKLGTERERERLEEIDAACKSWGFETLLPHRDIGRVLSFEDSERIFNKDIREGLSACDVIVASLDGLHVGAGTAWELGYAYARGMKCIALKMDESPQEGFDYLSPILIASTTFVSSLDELKKELQRLV